MLLKAKCAHEANLRDTQKQTNNEAGKLKKSKESKKKIPLALHINSLASVTSKRHHKTSKSTIQPSDNRLFNSPIMTYGLKEALPSNNVSFTHILEQNFKNQQLSHQMQNSQPNPVTYFQINEAPHIRSRQSNQFSNCSLSREKGIAQSKRSMQPKNKSPLRLQNTNRISTTPKLKQLKGQGEKQKTFKQLLQDKQNEDIKLQCSQKLFKYLDNKAIVPQKNLFCGSAKSNLLSTCAINLSQRCEHQKLPSLVRSSKGNISNKSVIDSLGNHTEIQQFFEEDDQDDTNNPNIQQKVMYLRSKIRQSNQQIEDISAQQNLSSLLSLLNQRNSSDRSQAINRLTTLKQQITLAVQQITNKLIYLSNKANKQIDNLISIMQDTQQTSIDWIKIQQKLALQDHLMSLQCQHQILAERTKEIQEQFKQGSHSKDQIQDILIWQAQLQDINSKIANISHLQAVEQSLMKHQRQPLQQIQEQIHKVTEFLSKVNLFKM